MASTRLTGIELLWVDGEPDDGLPNPNTASAIGTELYWTDGNPVMYLFPPSNSGSFLLVFN